MLTIGLNGFGRIGRNFVRTIMEDPSVQKKLTISAINIGPADPALVAYMFQYDTIMGTFKGNVSYDNGVLRINDTAITIIAEKDPRAIDWKRYHVAWVVDATGKFTQKEQAELHRTSGADHVLITAPSSDADFIVIPGINQDAFNPQKDHIVSLGSCTTNAIIPMIKVVDEAYGITAGTMTTIHAYTNSQVLIDVENKSPRTSRAAALNIIPTSTGASGMIDRIFPHLKGIIHTTAMRVPVANVSLIDFSCIPQRPCTKNELDAAFQKAAQTNLKGILTLSNQPLVSSDYIGSPYSVSIDSELTFASNAIIQVFGWYDNEWGYSQRLKDFLLFVEQKI